MAIGTDTLHPSDEVLHRFAEEETSRQESQKVVRHLLHGCGECGGKVIAALSSRGQEGDYESAFRRMRKEEKVRAC